VIAELTSRMDSRKITQSLADLERPFDPTQDSTQALQGLRELRRSDRSQYDQTVRPGYLRPVDVLLATSMLQVGVDVQRLGLMVTQTGGHEHLILEALKGRERRRQAVESGGSPRRGPRGHRRAVPRAGTLLVAEPLGRPRKSLETENLPEPRSHRRASRGIGRGRSAHGEGGAGPLPSGRRAARRGRPDRGFALRLFDRLGLHRRPDRLDRLPVPRSDRRHVVRAGALEGVRLRLLPSAGLDRGPRLGRSGRLYRPTFTGYASSAPARISIAFRSALSSST